MLIRIHPENPSVRHITQVVEMLKKDGVMIYPTDTVYAIGCSMKSPKAIDRLCEIIGKKPEEANLSLICSDLSSISEYTVPFDNKIYKLMRKTLPGAYTYILKANNKVPKLFKNKKRTIGIRVPDNNIPREIVKLLDSPLVTASLKSDDIEEYFTNAELLYEKFGNIVEVVIDGGVGNLEGSTVIDVSNGEIEVVREGKGPVEVI